MHENYSNFLEYRAVQRRLSAKFARPRRLMLHALIFVTTMTAIWIYGMIWQWWLFPFNFPLPIFVGTAWSIGLAVHAVLHYRHSSARAERRELAVEDAMREFIETAENGGDPVEQDSLFAMHLELESRLEQQGRWSLALLAFALINLPSWAISAYNMGSSWAFQMTLPLAAFILGGVPLFINWQQRQHDRVGWFVRLPLRHIIAYAGGVIGLWLAGAYRLINPLDANTLTQYWGVLLVVHILWSVIVGPLAGRILSARRQPEPQAKRKPVSRLVLADDGEVLDIVEPDAETDAEPDAESASEQYRARRS